MAREYAQIKLSIWADDDWRDLSPMGRYLYLTLLTSPTLTHCGTADWRPARIAALNGMTIADIATSGAELVESLHLVIDEESEEVLIRSFIRNDGLMKQPRMAVSMANAHAGVASQVLRGVVIHELKRLRKDYPDLAGWSKEKATDLLEMASIDPSTYPLGKGPFGGPFTPGLGETLPSVSGSPTPSPTPAPTPSSLSPSQSSANQAESVAEPTPRTPRSDTPERFEEFWNAYGKKVGRKAAEQKYRKALTKPGVTESLLIEAATAYVAWERANNQGGRFIYDPARWLNGEHWNDERIARPQPTTRVSEHLTLAQQLHAQTEQAQTYPEIGEAQ